MIIAAHAPPGYFERFAVIPFFNATYNSDYINLLNKHGKVIMAQIYGHEHTDSFRIFASDSGEYIWKCLELIGFVLDLLIWFIKYRM